MYLKERLAGGECLIGAGIYSNSVEMLEYAAEGMDWIWWEAQHAMGIGRPSPTASAWDTQCESRCLSVRGRMTPGQ